MNLILGQNKVRFIGSLGVDTWIFLNGNNKVIEFEDNKRVGSSSFDENGGFNPINISPIFSAGVDVKLTNSRT